MPPAPSSPAPDVLLRWAEQRGVELWPLLASLYLAGVDDLGVTPDDDLALLEGPGSSPPLRSDLPVPSDGVAPDLLGEVLGAAAASVRRDEGAVFTPRATAEGLVAAALAALPDGRRPGHVLDPSVGGGAFVLAVVRALAASGATPGEAAATIVGVDADPLSVAVTAAALDLWLVGRDGATARDAARAGARGPALHQRDLLLDPPPLVRSVDLVVGNPPFLSQLRRGTTRSPDQVVALRRRFGQAVGPYTDAAALFLLACLDVLDEGGVLALVQPRSFLGAGGAGEVRRRLLDRAALVGLWEPSTKVFAAAVHVCAPIFVAGAPQPPEVRVWHDATLAVQVGERRADQLLGGEAGGGIASSRDDQPPSVALPPHGGRLGDHASVTAGFRDQFYGMAPAVYEADGPDDPRPRLITSGLIDPGVDRWGVRRARYARRTWDAPVLQVDELDPEARVGRWVRARLVPKLVVASQTRVIEAFLDLEGRVVPSPPAIAVEAPPDALPRLLAALLAPATTAWIHRRAAGTGMAPDALRISVADLVEVPLPGDRRSWDEAARLLSEICCGPDARPLGDDEPTRRFAAAVNDAYGLPPLTGDAATAWWLARLPVASIA